MFGWGAKGGHIVETDLSAYADGAVSPRLASRIEAHTAACNECSVLLQELRATKTMLSRLPSMTTQRSFTLGPEYATQLPSPRPAPMRNMLGFAPALALSVLVVLLAVDLLPGGGSSSENTTASAPGAYDAAGATESKATAAAPTPQTRPFILEAPAGVPPKPPVAPATGNAGGSAAPTPQAATARSDTAPPVLTPSAAPGQPLRPPPSVEGFNPQAPAPTPLVSTKPPLQSTGASAHNSGVSFLRILELIAAGAFFVSAGAFVWDKKRR